ncbi:MAG: aldo/keto reductase [Armatimonadota bacterium]|jgi:predicted aldo/keto reductase-like oxidoreductase
MPKLTRRQFIAGAAAAGTAAMAGGFTHAAQPAGKPRTGADLVALGKTGLTTSLLGVGTGTRGGSEQRMLGPDAFTQLVRHAYDRGIRYIDTADRYRMHGLVRTAIRGLPREDLFLQTKSPARTAEEATADVERFRAELGVDYLDTVLMHCMTRRTFPTDMRPVLDALREAKQKGAVRAVGVSCHGFPPLEASADCEGLDVHLVRINPFGDKMGGTPQDVAAQIEKMSEDNRGVIGMKIFGETGFDSTEKRLQSLRYVLGLGTVHAFTIGFTSTEQIDDTLDLIHQATT